VASSKLEHLSSWWFCQINIHARWKVVEVEGCMLTGNFSIEQKWLDCLFGAGFLVESVCHLWRDLRRISFLPKKMALCSWWQSFHFRFLAYHWLEIVIQHHNAQWNKKLILILDPPEKKCEWSTMPPNEFEMGLVNQTWLPIIHEVSC